MALSVTPRWRSGDAELDSRLIPLLRTIAKEGSLNRAVAALGLSYRHAWGLVGKSERTLGHSLVAMARGRGARLTLFAEKLLAADAAAAGLLERELAAALEALDHGRIAANRPLRRKPLVVHASHDLALAAIREQLASAGDPPIELHFRGSVECLASLKRGECEVAGFHLAASAARNAMLEQYQPWLRLRGLSLVHFVTRRQGLMVARGNPLGIRSLSDLRRAKSRFVNRQAGSGTRLLFDHVLNEARVAPSQINGYALEEFTHAAVAATVASGMADAGFGIEAAARRQRLDFVPLADEHYYLAARRSTLGKPGWRALMKVLRGGLLRDVLRRLPGYAAPPSFELRPARALF
ncbi:MAG TPA: substrate-binding domain-containing protein [Burkholderiales bacterium]|nr:substrate-binding domain-containing protein [Burkholderiales bacterium]